MESAEALNGIYSNLYKSHVTRLRKVTYSGMDKNIRNELLEVEKKIRDGYAGSSEGKWFKEKIGKLNVAALKLLAKEFGIRKRSTMVKDSLISSLLVQHKQDVIDEARIRQMKKLKVLDNSLNKNAFAQLLNFSILRGMKVELLGGAKGTYIYILLFRSFSNSFQECFLSLLLE